MHIRVLAAAGLAVVLLGAGYRPARLTVYSAPAANRLAGSSSGHPLDAVLPNGRIVAPVGRALLIGSNPLGVALSPDGRFAIVSNDDQDASVAVPPTAAFVAGYSLAAVDTRTMAIASVYHDPYAYFFVGVASVRDPADPARTIVLASEGANNAVVVFDLSSTGNLVPEAQSIHLDKGTFPASIAIDPTGHVAYVSGNQGDTVTAIDIASRTVLHTVPVGYAPFGVAATLTHVYATNGGLSTYPVLGRPVRTPQFAQPNVDPEKSSSLSVIPEIAGGDISTDVNHMASVRMDTTLDGVREVGGDRPGAIAVRRDGRYAYVALSNVDRVAILSLEGNARVVGGLDLRQFPGGPYGTQPSAIALSPDGKTLYIALAGLDAVAVLDARNPADIHRLGLIPTGWYPSALTLSQDGRYLYVTSAKGVDGWGTLQRVDLRHEDLRRTTLAALHYQRTGALAKQNAVVPPMGSNARSNVIDHVVYVSVGSSTFDAMLGDMRNADGTPHGNAAPAFAVYPQDETPNLHALAAAYGLADNFYADDSDPDVNRLFALGGAATLYSQRTLPVNAGRAPLDAHGADPEDYARVGDVFNSLQRAGVSFRDYGEMMQLSGFNATQKDPAGLGGAYALDIPALAALANNVDLDYPVSNAEISDHRRAQEFIGDMGRLVQAGTEPAFTYVSLPSAADRNSVADADRALGSIVEFLAQTPHWSSTAVFVVPEGASGADHVSRYRSYALVVSPLAKPGFVGHAHLSAASVLKTEEELLGLPPLSLNDYLATDLAEFFSDVPYPTPYHAIP